MAMKGYSSFIKFQYYWSYTIRLFRVIYRILVQRRGVLPLCKYAVGVFFSPSPGTFGGLEACNIIWFFFQNFPIFNSQMKRIRIKISLYSIDFNGKSTYPRVISCIKVKELHSLYLDIYILGAVVCKLFCTRFSLMRIIFKQIQMTQGLDPNRYWLSWREWS